MNIRVGISRTINTGNFENIKPSVEVEDSLLEDETYEEGYERIKNVCQELFNSEMEYIEEDVKNEEKKKWTDKYNKVNKLT